MARTGRYTARDIAVLEGLQAVRKRPGMYIGGTGTSGLHHLLWEIVDNAVDEHIGGFASTVEVTLHSSGDMITVRDNGRGIPVDKHPTENRSALEVVFTTLHAGGKFEKNGAYVTSGGLHGVGSSVVNALSSRLEARVRRDGAEYLQEYRRGRPRAAVAEVGPARGTGTIITFQPDPQIFDDVIFDPQLIHERLDIKAYLHRGLKVVFRDQVNKVTHELRHPGGVADFLTAIARAEDRAVIVDAPFALDREESPRFELALTWTDTARERVRSYVNGIPTADGGTHEQGLRDALGKALRSYAETHSLVPRGITLTADDIRDGVVAVLSMYVEDPQFQGQTKNRLNNPEIRTAVDGAVRPALEQWLHHNPSRGQLVVGRAVQAARARIASRQASAAVRRRASTSRKLNLPGKLADCSSNDTESRELFIVEGDSAGGSAKQGRDRKTQAVLPLRGKVLNAMQATPAKVLKNEELSNIVTALGCGLGKDFREERLRYQRIILLMDADSDGHHIATLLLTFFFRYLRPLLENGYVYIAQPPLYRVNVGKKTHWALDDRHRDRIVRGLPARAKPEITRFKGLGEMPPKTLFQTTLDPKRRRLLQVGIPDGPLAELTLSDLLGRDASKRYAFIMERANEVDEIDV